MNLDIKAANDNMVYAMKPELLSPAGDMECLENALLFGADAVYLAGQEFGMRTAPKNFTAEELGLAVKFAHEKGKKLYVTCNTLPRNNELDRLPQFIEELQHSGADAVIVADLGVMELVKKHAPKLEIHMSTQTGIVNYKTAETLYNMGASRVVLARELSLDEIAAIKAKAPKELEIECFVHGAMCVSFSGRCIISGYLTGRDANRGDCAQPCRWKYSLCEEKRPGEYFPIEEEDGGTFLYNSKDMCMIDYIPQLVKAGISSFKIEGRAKSAYYTSVVTNAYRHAIDEYFNTCHNEGDVFSLPLWIREELEKVSHREYSTGFYLGNEPGQTTENGGYIRKYDVIAVCQGENDGKSFVTQRNKFLKGCVADVLPPSGIPFEVTIDEIHTLYGEEVLSAPHPMQELLLTTSKEIPAGSILRQKRLSN